MLQTFKTLIGSTSSFKATNGFEKRKIEATRIRLKYPDRVPVIVETNSNLTLTKRKYLAPYDITFGQFQYIIRKFLKLAPDEAVFLFINNTLPAQQATMESLYQLNREACGFLYVCVNKEATFG